MPKVSRAVVNTANASSASPRSAPGSDRTNLEPVPVGSRRGSARGGPPPGPSRQRHRHLGGPLRVGGPEPFFCLVSSAVAAWPSPRSAAFAFASLPEFLLTSADPTSTQLRGGRLFALFRRRGALEGSYATASGAFALAYLRVLRSGRVLHDRCCQRPRCRTRLFVADLLVAPLSFFWSVMIPKIRVLGRGGTAGHGIVRRRRTPSRPSAAVEENGLPRWRIGAHRYDPLGPGICS